MIKLADLLRKKSHDNILIIIVPRHINRSLGIQNRIKAAGFDIKSRSKGEYPSKNDVFYLSDTMGEMGSLMEISDLVFVAGSMVPVGGHSPSEASQFGKPVIMGPHSEKCDALGITFFRVWTHYNWLTKLRCFRWAVTSNRHHRSSYKN